MRATSASLTHSNRLRQLLVQQNDPWMAFYVAILWPWLLPWWSGVVVSALVSINEVNLRRARLVLRRVTVSGFSYRCRTFISVCNQPATQANSTLYPSGVGKWVPASAGKAKAGMVHSVNGWTRGVQVKVWDLLITRAVPERLTGMFTTKRYTNPRLSFTYNVLVASVCVSACLYDCL